ncbi:DUF1501 domain-containing protein [Lignipirellula cremea]|uniref:DUF1501 domain-containing protein n=1 Tax=Lignipirellula cremea TaxID=2528010 RepID=A0A518DQQ6_9BACT|nr:DUF1501 domain-containing protein [Lignipirellula cremea]QDU94173.1 hypothetical protein Pla8534_19610 [Lignipirellula cremea]
MLNPRSNSLLHSRSRSASHAALPTRRQALQVGALGAVGLSLSGYLRQAAAGEVRPAKGKSAIVIWLGGGPPHLDMFDMKPDAPDEFRGEFHPRPTNVPGVQICEHLPQLAACADKYAILNGVSHTLAGHELGTTYLSTGNRPLPSLAYPGYGAVVSKELPGDQQLPHFVAVPSTPQTAGYLGVPSAPLSTNDTPRRGQPFGVRGISLSSGLTIDAFEQRQKLLQSIDTEFDSLAGENSLVDGLDRFDEQAFAVIRSEKARTAFDVSQENPETAAAFGDSRFGQSCLLAARLVEAGVRFVTVSFSGWDTHTGNFKKAKESLLPAFDQGLAALLNTLSERGLLESTSVLTTGEFGRTPKINARAGRDHWPRAFSVLMAGAGVQGGQVLGQSDAHGKGPAGEPITPEQIGASFYSSLGIDYQKEYHTQTGRPVMIVRSGSLVPGLF